MFKNGRRAAPVPPSHQWVWIGTRDMPVLWRRTRAELWWRSFAREDG